MKKSALLILIFIITQTSGKSQSLTKTRWFLTKVTSGTPEQNVLKDTLMKAILFFDSDTSFTGAFCNRYFGKCRIGKNGSLTMQRPTASRRFCQGGYSELEGKLFNWYTKANRYELKNGELVLFTIENEKLVFTKNK